MYDNVIEEMCEATVTKKLDSPKRINLMKSLVAK